MKLRPPTRPRPTAAITARISLPGSRGGPTNGNRISRRARLRSIASIEYTTSIDTPRSSSAVWTWSRWSRDAAISSAISGTPARVSRNSGDDRTVSFGVRLRSASDMPSAAIRVVSRPIASSIDERSGFQASPPATARRRSSGSAAGPSQSRSSTLRTMWPARRHSSWVAGGSGSSRRARRSEVSASRPRSLGRPISPNSLTPRVASRTAPSVAQNRCCAAGSRSSATTSHSSRTSVGWPAVATPGPATMYRPSCSIAISRSGSGAPGLQRASSTRRAELARLLGAPMMRRNSSRGTMSSGGGRAIICSAAAVSSCCTRRC